jgi:hypothetical protein
MPKEGEETKNADQILEPEIVEEDEEKELVSGSIPILSTEAFKFAQLVASGVGPTDAYKQVYPDKALRLKRIAVAAYHLAHNPKVREQITIIQEAVRLQLIAEAPAAFDRLKELSENAKGEKVKLDANIEILDRAGLKPPQRVEQIQIGLWGSLSQEDMRSIVKRRLENR